ncbi:hypothetical protein DMB66_39180 [Actinoplanes sp. ATCC 53533]|uniref:hypothetical protein n=1 Tax=Actinoplanes sp. ATCC 53533 TaxID=1288362 RepID=UPI000F77AA2C|nr:hypothetical protein [Actinoplanes sp. ATCC 53533]RSM53249.1 hypothetical protein DMB66_39180 [Actinoplanes sp. ATCC 53533]
MSAARLFFGLAGALRLAEHASAAPAHLRRPGRPFPGTPALRLVVETVPGLRPVAYLLSCGVPFLARHDGTPVALYADRTPEMPDGLPGQPHEVIDLNQLSSAGTITGRPLPIASGWYLPLHPPGQQSQLDFLRAAADAGYGHVSIDAGDLTLAVAKRRHRPLQPC